MSAPPERVFALIDDHERLSSHMSQSSWRMAVGRMKSVLDAQRGQRVGSHIQMQGHVLGFEVSFEEMVTEREPPTRTTWTTVDSPRLVIIGPYRMGFDVAPRENGFRLRVFIDCALPSSWPLRWLGRVFGGYYAHWCVQSMVNNAVRQFAGNAQPARESPQ